MEYKVTSIDELKVMSGGEIVKLPPFVQGADFYAKLRSRTVRTDPKFSAKDS